MKTIRCSSLPTLFDCPPALQGEMKVTASHEAAVGGNAVHDAMRPLVQGLEPDLDAIALRFGTDRDELGRLTWYGRKAWAQLAPSFPDPETEVTVVARFGDVEIPGHIDIRSRHGRVTHMGDWKSGRLDRNYYHQFAGYAAGEFADNPDCQEVVFCAVWLRDQDVETYRFTRADIAEWGTELVTLLERQDDFRTGPQCSFCPRSHECPALMAVVRRDVGMFSVEAPENFLAGATSDQLIAILRRAKVVAKFAEGAAELVRARIQQAGTIVGSDGTKLVLAQEKGKRVVDTLKAWPVLEARLTAEEIAGCVDVKISAAEEAVAAKAPDRGKGKAKKELGAALEAAGAITQGIVFKLREVRPPFKELSK